MEDENRLAEAEDQKYGTWPAMSPEIVEIGDDSKSMIRTRGEVINDVYVAVGRDDLDVVKWALDHAVSPGTCIFLIHVYSPITYIPTPVGRLSRSQLSQEQARVYINEEHNRRRSILQKYIRLCTDAKVMVDTVLLESNATAKAILDLIPVLNITNLVIGTKRPPSSRQHRKGLGKGELVQKKAPEFCEVTIVYDGKKVINPQHATEPVPSSLASSHQRPDIARHSERNFFDCICFSGRFN